MIYLELKKGEPISFEKALGAYIKKNYNEKPKVFEDDFKVLENLRKEAISGEIGTGAITCLHRYYEQLKGIQSRFPIDESNVKISFPWYNSLPKDKRLITNFNISFEKAALLFNIGVIYYQLGMNEMPHQSNIACDHFSKAAGTFKLLLDEYSGNLSIPPTCDLTSASVSSLMKLMLAKAQECFVSKALLQGKSNLVIKLSSSCGDFYDAAFDAIYNSPVASSFGPNWLYELQALALYHFSTAQWKKSIELLNEAKYGEQVCRLQCALDLCKKAIDMSKFLSQEVLNEIQRQYRDIEAAFKVADRDNNLIYHEPVPNIKSFPPLARADVVSAKNPLTDPVNTISLFSSLVPLLIHHAIGNYKERKEKVLTGILKEYGSMDQDIQTALTKMNFPGAIEAFEKPKGIPESVLKKSNQLRTEQAAQSLEASLRNVTALASQAEDIVDELSSALENEEKEDTAMRSQFGSKWNRQPSKELNSKLIKLLNKYKNTLMEAKKSDQTVTKRYEMYIPSIEHLCSLKTELESIIPDCSVISPKVKNETVEKLKENLSELDNVRTKERELISSIKTMADTDDISKVLLQTPTNTNFEPIFEESLAKYEEGKKELATLKQKHVKLLEALNVGHVEFEETKKSNASIKQREFALQALDEGYQYYGVLKDNFKEGIKFYVDLIKLLQNMKGDVDDYTLSRRIEYKDLLKSIQSKAISSKGPEESEDKKSTLTVSSIGSEVDINARRYSDDLNAQAPFYQPPGFTQPSAPTVHSSAPPISASGGSFYQSAAPLNYGSPPYGMQYSGGQSMSGHPPYAHVSHAPIYGGEGMSHSSHIGPTSYYRPSTFMGPSGSGQAPSSYHQTPPPPSSSQSYEATPYQMYGSHQPPPSHGGRYGGGVTSGGYNGPYFPEGVSRGYQSQSYGQSQSGPPPPQHGAWDPTMPIQYAPSGSQQPSSGPPPLPQKPQYHYYGDGNGGR